MARYSRSRGSRRTTRRGASYYGGRSRSRSSVRRGAYGGSRTQRIEIVHVMGPGGPVAMMGNSPAGTIGVSQVKKPKKGGF